MENPVVAQKSPFGTTLKPGKYAWCACGRSGKQPFCDGSHKGSGFSPKIFEVSEEQEVWLCGCKHSKNAPFCDGTHKTL